MYTFANDQSAQDAYASAHAQALDLLAQLNERIENLPAPDETTHWGHVGDIGRYVDLLNQALGSEA